MSYGTHVTRHSDFTVPIDNRCTSPPLSLSEADHDEQEDRRPIFGNATSRKYHLHITALPQDISVDHLPENDLIEVQQQQQQQHPPRTKRVHETIHAQSLLLGLAFLCVWSPNNMMAPNLTEMAREFHFDDVQRDLYLGSYCALALGVLSFPIAASIGVACDFASRKALFCLTIAGGALSSLLTAYCTTFWALFVARLVNGGFMSGSVPVAFSLLGDLFHVHERNAASSGLTAMMGAGIIIGQVYAGTIANDWPYPFVISGIGTGIAALLCLLFVKEPVRGGKEAVLQDMIQSGTKYERTLTWDGFVHAMRHNQSNRILLWQGFFSSLPWGILFVFLNDYFSQEKGFTVRAATFLVLVFGIGCALGGILGGYFGQKALSVNRSYLPLFMAATTLLGTVPFLMLLNMELTENIAAVLSFLSGLIASLPSVNVRPCLINVNPPETRGASLTAANLLIQLGRGLGPSFVTLMGSIWKVDRTFAFNVNISLFWIISGLQLILLAKTLPADQDQMEMELARYAQEQMYGGASEESFTIEDRMTYFESTAARETLEYMREGLEEVLMPFQCGRVDSDEEKTQMFDTYPDESTSLIV